MGYWATRDSNKTGIYNSVHDDNAAEMYMYNA